MNKRGKVNKAFKVNGILKWSVLMCACGILTACSGSKPTEIDTKDAEETMAESSTMFHYEISAESDSKESGNQVEAKTEENVETEINTETETNTETNTEIETKEEMEATAETEESLAIEAQIALIAQNRSMWAGDTEYGDVYFYTVTDLDHNGRLEVISSSMQGSGLYTYSQYFEVNEAMTELISLNKEGKEGHSEADIIVSSASVYESSESSVSYYVFRDSIRNGAAEYYENLRALYLMEGSVKEIPLASKSEIYTADSEQPVVTWERIREEGTVEEISEDEYEGIADIRFADMEKHTVHFAWEEQGEKEAFLQMGEAELEEKLLASYQSFV